MSEQRAKPEITLVVPIQSLEAEVEAVVLALGGSLDQLGRTWEALLVYDGIKGELWDVGLRLQAETNQQVRTIALHKPFGESVCLSSSFEHARGDLILTSPQYVQVDPHDLAGMLERMDDGADLVTPPKTFLMRPPFPDSKGSRISGATTDLCVTTTGTNHPIPVWVDITGDAYPASGTGIWTPFTFATSRETYSNIFPSPKDRSLLCAPTW